MPVVFAFANDNPEGQLAANIFNSAQAKAPCRVCNCSGCDFNDPQRGLRYTMRTTKGTAAARKEALGKEKGQVKRLKAISVHATGSCFAGLWWGGNPNGIHFAAGSDWMHLMHEGLGKHLMVYVCAVLKKAGKLQKVDSYVAALNRRTSAFLTGLKKN